MSNIFKERQQYVKKPERNNFPLSFTNNFSTRIGRILPIMCKETVPGDSFSIDTSLGLHALPMVFPIQTDVTCEVEFYYVPCRILWKDFKDFIGRTKDNLVHPFISIPYTRASEIGTGSLADYLGVPTTYAGQYGSVFSLSFSYANKTPVFNDSTITTYQNESIDGQLTITSSSTVPADLPDGLRYRYTLFYISSLTDPFTPRSFSFVSSRPTYYFGFLTQPFHYVPTTLSFSNTSNIQDGDYPVTLSFYSVERDSSNNIVDAASRPLGVLDNLSLHIDLQRSICEIDIPDVSQDFISQLLSSEGEIRCFICQKNTDSNIIFASSDSQGQLPQFYSPLLVSTNENITEDVSPELNPFVIQQNEQYPAIRLNALPFRAYEAIYNTYKRNNFINPLRINNEIEYNEVVTNRMQGADSITPLYLRNRNYELDFLTDARTSPQQGIAPLVGVTENGTFKFEDENGQQFTLKPILNDDGDTITGIEEYDEGLPTGSIQQLQQMINYGISISTFRATNALQVWLETNIRRGFKYEDQMLSHFGVNVTKLELQEPIFIGGFTRRLEVQQINATATSGGINLGDYAGQAGLFSQSKHNINYHCQEHGFIIATLTIVPIPSYSQLLPKLFLKNNALDYYFKEFSHLSMQPITYNEVCPIQSFIAGDDLNDVFGYQRPNYDLVANVDEAHGLMRTKFQNYLLTRVFANRPQLSQSFIEVNPSELTSPFVDTSVDEDTFLGQVYFDISAKRPIPRIAIARLEP